MPIHETKKQSSSLTDIAPLLVMPATVAGLGIVRHPVTCLGFRNKINQVPVTGWLCCKSGLRVRRRRASLSVTPPVLVAHGLRSTGYGATAKIRGRWGCAILPWVGG